MSEFKSDPSTLQAKPVGSLLSQLGEGPLWIQKCSTLYWVDILGHRLNYINLRTEALGSWTYEEPCCAVAESDESSLLLALAKRIVRIDGDGEIIETVCEIEPHLLENRCNDGKIDPAGRFWIGTMQQEGRAGEGSLYRLDKRNRPVRVLDGLSVANGLAWSADSRTMFYIDSLSREIWAFDFDPADSSISNRKTVVHIPESMGIADGMSIDSNGNLWVAHWGDGAVRCWNPRTGQHLFTVQTSDKLTTSCTFGGIHGNTLFITSATDTDAPERSKGQLSSINLAL